MNILVVDDSMAMRMIVIKTLREAGYGGHDIAQAADGALALEHIKKDEPDLVLCDWNMPNMTGPELLATLNDEGIKPKFGFVTTEGTDAMREKASELGARFVITKPFTPESFKAELDKYLN
ncbi:MAG: response regulator [Gammaproteobacteria bacterium]|nr:response regulator [Gammaproteobacteria bacterium]